MSDEATTAEPAAPAAAESAAAPAAAPANESIADKMRRLGGDEVFNDPGKPPGRQPEPAAAEAAPEEPADKKAKPKKETKPEPSSAGDIEQVRQMATRLGLVVEDGKVTTPERVKLREERRNNLEAIRRAEAEAMERVNKALADGQPKLERATAIEAAAVAGDYDGIGRALGFKDWNALQEDQLARLQDPNHKRIRELEERLRQEDEARKQQAAQAEQENATRAELHAQAEYKRGLATTMSGSTNPLVKALAQMPNFVNAVFNVQRAVYQGRGETVTPEQAILIPANGAPALRDELKALYDALHPVFYKPEAASAAPAGTTAKPKPKTPAVPTAAPLPAKTQAQLVEREWRQDAARRLEEAQAEDRRRRANGIRT